MVLQLSTRWLAGNEELDRRLLPLLRAVAASGSLNRAVLSLKLSYRHAWGLLGKMERAIGQPLVIMERGRGARLSPAGEHLVAADDGALELLRRELPATLQSLNRALAAPRQPRREKSLVIHASHDFALAALRDLLARSARGGPELHFRGSLECLADLARGLCDVAGFHLPDVPVDSSAYRPYLPWLKARSLRLIRFVTRRQGLMVARGNPKRILSLADLTGSGIRFINRQPGSGTRLCLDHLLAAAGIRPGRINGYQLEEFTHAAVAATVASGMADAGFGIEAAAQQQDLDFVPLATERYFLATRQAALSNKPMQVFLEALKSPAFRKRREALAGYGARNIGEIVSARDALRAF